MNMVNKIKNSGLFSVIAVLTVISSLFYSCKKAGVVTPDKEVAFFATTGPSAIYRMTSATQIYKIPLGLTKIPGGARTITVAVTSPTGAVQGTQYTLNKTSITFDNAKIVDTIVVAAAYPLYQGSRIDTLKFSFTNAADGIPSLSNTFTLIVRGPCLEADMAMVDLLGNYTKTFENGSYGPYTSAFTGNTAITSKSAKTILSNIYDNAISAEAVLNWSVSGSFTITIAAQPTPYAVGGLPLFVRSVGAGTFVYCTQRFTIPMELYTSAGIYDQWIMTMAR